MRHLPFLPLAIFAATYVALAAGRLPRLALDRTGCAFLGAVGMLLTGTLSLEQAAGAVDVSTLAVLFGMMLLSEQYHLSGLYGAIGARLAAMSNPRALLGGTIAVAAVLSALLTNDVICFALTPLLGRSLLAARRDPIPYLLALAAASNLGSALTPIGNPQTILIAQHLHLAFLPFVAACAVPVVLSLGVLYLLLVRRVTGPPLDRPEDRPEDRETAAAALRGPLGWPAVKAIGLTAVAVLLFLSPLPSALTALGIAGGVLLSRRATTRALLDAVDWPLLALFVSLFIVVRGFEISGWAAAAASTLAASGAEILHPAVLVPVTAVLSNLVSNVPATMLLLPFAGGSPATGYTLALAGTFAGNALLVGSIANLIVVERAAGLGIRLGFRDHLRLGLPLSLISLTLVAVAARISW